MRAQPGVAARAAMMTCHMICQSNSPHLSQVYTGFALLQRGGVIRLTQECCRRNFFDPAKPQHLRDAGHAHLTVVLNGGVKLFYDTHDSQEVDEEAAAAADYYFKRSYAPAEVPAHLSGKVFPLGLNYQLYTERPDRLEEERVAAFEPASKRWTPGSAPNAPAFRPTPRNMYSAPDHSREPRALFMTRAWEPDDNPDRTAEKVAERVRLNDARARCVELLRREFGERFLGGFEHTEYASKNYGGVLLEDGEASSKGNYVGLLSRHAVCVATTGLHRSAGWKLAEYVAFSKAIVSEPLACELPGRFEAGKNYLEFADPEGCVAAVRRLFADAALRRRMMRRNHLYYLGRLRPDALILRTLRVASRPSKARTGRSTF